MHMHRHRPCTFLLRIRNLYSKISLTMIRNSFLLTNWCNIECQNIPLKSPMFVKSVVRVLSEMINSQFTGEELILGRGLTLAICVIGEVWILPVLFITKRNMSNKM